MHVVHPDAWWLIASYGRVAPDSERRAVARPVQAILEEGRLPVPADAAASAPGSEQCANHERGDTL